MPIRLPDQFHSLREVAALSNTPYRLHMKSLTWCSLNQTGGLITREDFFLVSAGTGASERHATECERSGAWHDARQHCGSEFCLGPADADGWVIHDFYRYDVPEEPATDAAASPAPPQAPAVPDVAPPAAPQAPVARARTAGARKQALSRSGIKHAVRERDGDRCRYCGVKVQWGTGRASDSATYDFTDPDGPVETSNVVVACAACHSAKGDRTPEGAGMELLPVPACTPSELGKRKCTPSRTPSRKGYTEETPAQKGYTLRTPSPRSDDLDFDPDLDINQSSLVNRVKGRNAREPKPGSAQFRLQVQSEMALKVPDEVDDAAADSIAADVLGSAKGRVDHPLLYVLKAIRDEKDPRGRWLPKREAKPRERRRYPWCGQCEETDRATYDEQGRLAPCPRCSGYVPDWLEAV